jgi:4'-phosphopantetheinyl transferase
VIEIHAINAFISIGILDLALFGVSGKVTTNREKEKLGTRFLLKAMLKNEAFELLYTPEKKPYLNRRNEHISISHSHDKLAIIINSKETTGIDIELIRDKVLMITHKFLNATESEFAGSDVERLITIWAAKEAMYKVYGLKGLDFKVNLSVTPFNSNEIFGNINIGAANRKYALWKEKIDNYIMVYIQYEIQQAG